MNQGGDKSKAPNKFGTEPKHRTEQTLSNLGSRTRAARDRALQTRGHPAPGKLRPEQPRNLEISKFLIQNSSGLGAARTVVVET